MGFAVGRSRGMQDRSFAVACRGDDEDLMLSVKRARVQFDEVLDIILANDVDSDEESGVDSDEEVCEIEVALGHGADGFAEVFAAREEQEDFPMIEAVSPEMLEFQGSKTIQEECVSGMLCKYEGILVHLDEYPRAFPGALWGGSYSPKRALTSSCMVDMVLVDRTGPMRFALSGTEEVVESFMSEANIASTNGKIVALSVVRIGALPENFWNGKSLTRCRALATVATSGNALGTCVTFPECASSPFLLTSAFAIPSVLGCISLYGPVAPQMKSPFRSTVRGWVCDVQIPSCKHPVRPYRRFKLLDGTGAYIQCCALFHNVRSPAISIGREIILYYGTGRGPTGNVPGMLYALKDSLILAVGSEISLSLCVLGCRVDIE